jgi:hypothetical protein
VFFPKKFKDPDLSRNMTILQTRIKKKIFNPTGCRSAVVYTGMASNQCVVAHMEESLGHKMCSGDHVCI